MKSNPLNEKAKKDKVVMNRITTMDMVCKTCRYLYDDSKLARNTTRCEVYTMKPFEVLSGGDCVSYEKGEPHGNYSKEQ